MNGTAQQVNSQGSPRPKTHRVDQSSKKHSVSFAISSRFCIILFFLALLIFQILQALAIVRDVKVDVANENVKKESYYKAAMLDPSKETSLSANVAQCDAAIDKYESELDTKIFWVTLGCASNVLFIMMTTSSTLLYIRKHVVLPLEQFKVEAEKLVIGDLKVDFGTESKALEIYALGYSLDVCTDEIERVIALMTVGLGELCDKNFVEVAPGGFLGDFYPMEEYFRKLAKEMGLTLREIVQAAREVSTGSQQVASGAQSLAEGATEQATSVDHLSATISTIARMVADTAESAKEANHLGQTASAVLEKGSQEMVELMDAISQIERSSSDIEQIIKTIDDIAFQTNILALNAAVEAARAGTAGRSFAVVADEVRGLAQSSAKAAQDTNTLIDSSLEAIRRGAAIAKSTDEAFKEVRENSEKMLGVVQHIANSSQMQSGSVDDISNNIGEINAVISNNSATSEESAAASEELSGQAAMMSDMLGEFRLTKKVMMGNTVHSPKE